MGEFWRTDVAHNEEFKLDNLLSMIIRPSNENTSEEYFLRLFLLSFLNLMNFLDPCKVEVIVEEYHFQPLL